MDGLADRLVDLPLNPGGAVVLAVGAAAGATALLLPLRWPGRAATWRPGGSGRGAGRGAGRGEPERRLGAGSASAILVTTALVGAAALALGVPGRRLVLLVLAVAAAGVASRLLARRRARARTVATRGRVLELCEELGAELLAGRTTGEALSRAARHWAPLRPVAEADRLGGDVPQALRLLAAGEPGAADLVAVAAAWHVARRTGQGLGTALVRVARELRAQASLRRVVDGELASARATARLVAVLPLLALAMGSGAGGDPWGFLLDTPAGLACLASGLGLGALGLTWIEAIAADIDREAP